MYSSSRSLSLTAQPYSAPVLQRLDDSLLYAMRTRWHGPRREACAQFLALLGLAMGLADPDHGEEWVVAAALGPFAIGVNYAVKLVVRRPRPVLEGLPPLGGAPSSLSFPSAHSTASFAAATAMTRIEPSSAVLFVLAALIALGRPYLGMHYPSDVLAGALLGTALGLLAPLDLLS